MRCPIDQINRRGGFSLLELLVVLVIIAVSSALIGPRVAGSLATANLKTAAKRVAAALRYARSQAASEKIAYVAMFDLETGSLGISPREPMGEKSAGTAPGEDEGASKPAKVYRLPEDVRIERASAGEVETESGIFEILFYPTGGSSGGEVLLQNERERRYWIRVDFVTGTVKLAAEEKG